jgi:hypothetical protein
MEHGGLANHEQRARAIALGIPVTIKQPLLHDTAEVEQSDSGGPNGSPRSSPPGAGWTTEAR